MRLTWAQPEDLLAHELVQAAYEGKEVAQIRQRWEAAGGDATPAVSGASATPAPSHLRALARELLAELDEIPAASDPQQPDEWGQIAPLLGTANTAGIASGPASTATTQVSSDEGYQSRLLGAWTGRAAGCLLGKPVEKIPRQGIEEILRSTGRWPLDRWFTARGLPEDVAQRWPWNRRSAPTSLEENINGMPEDDDLNYPLLALSLLEDSGFDFTTENVAQLWLDNLPAGRVFTAERAAYRNILDARPVPETATHLNPFREWIGALIRTDVFGWVLPGRLQDAAYLAWKDARLSHTRNGIYGAMWAAGLTSASMVASSATEVLDLAETIVPPHSELAQAIATGRRIGRAHEHTDAGIARSLDELHAAYGNLHWVHTLNNAAVIAFALEAGTDFGHAISLAVLPGWDTDSAGATVGAVMGALVGTSGIGEQWYGPIQGRINTSLPGGEQQISALVERSLTLLAAGRTWQGAPQ